MSGRIQNVFHWTKLITQAKKHYSTVSESIQISAEVSAALKRGKPIIALESTIITHGLTYPQNYRTALSVESIIRKNGVIPATIAILNGNIHIGLKDEEIKFLATANGVLKTSKRDIPFMLSKGFSGGTTVSATIAVAHKVGIPIFVTGGIGGVHREHEKTLDISTDLTELGKTPISVICAGIKSILDVGNTLEYMETQGVCVVTYGPTLEFPGFFTTQSGHSAPCNVNSPKEAAQLIARWQQLQIDSGILMAVPIPREKSLDGKLIEKAIQEALADTSKLNISGKNVTPYILQRVNELTCGATLDANIALIENNAKVGSEIAIELADWTKTKGQSSVKWTPSKPHSSQEMPSRKKHQNNPVVIGGSNVDFLVQVLDDDLKPDGSTNKGKIQQSFGGVGRNLACALCQLDQDPLFISAVGQDYLGNQLLDAVPNLESRGILRSPKQATATYCVVLEKSGEVFLGVGDMNIHQEISVEHVSGFLEQLQTASMVIMDGNTPQQTLDYVLDACAESATAVWYEPTDSNRAGNPFKSTRWHNICYISPNLRELKSIYSTVTGKTISTQEDDSRHSLDQLLEECIHLVVPIMEHIHCAVVTLGKLGLLIVRNTDADHPFPMKVTKQKSEMSAIYFPAPQTTMVTSVSGAGDCLAATMIAGIIKGSLPEKSALSGLYAAHLSLQSHLTVPKELTYDTAFNSDLNQLSVLSSCKSRCILLQK